MSSEHNTPIPEHDSRWADFFSRSGGHARVGESRRLPLVSSGRLDLLRTTDADHDEVRELFDADTIERASQRFLVRFEWETNEGDYGNGEAIEVSEEQGPIWLHVERDEELVIKVSPDYENLDMESNRYWVFARQRIDVDVRMQVYDRWTGAGWRYGNARAEIPAAT